MLFTPKYFYITHFRAISAILAFSMRLYLKCLKSYRAEIQNLSYLPPNIFLDLFWSYIEHILFSTFWYWRAPQPSAGARRRDAECPQTSSILWKLSEDEFSNNQCYDTPRPSPMLVHKEGFAVTSTTIVSLLYLMIHQCQRIEGSLFSFSKSVCWFDHMLVIFILTLQNGQLQQCSSACL